MSEKKHTKSGNKIKNLKINEDIHTKLKQYCNENGLKIFAFVEKLINENCKIIEEEKNIYNE